VCVCVRGEGTYTLVVDVLKGHRTDGHADRLRRDLVGPVYPELVFNGSSTNLCYDADEGNACEPSP
jgi:hypothetical protein